MREWLNQPVSALWLLGPMGVGPLIGVVFAHWLDGRRK